MLLSKPFLFEPLETTQACEVTGTIDVQAKFDGVGNESCESSP